MIAIITSKDLSCQHPKESMEYQPEEKENNVCEYMYCEDCGEELPLPDNPEIN